MGLFFNRAKRVPAIADAEHPIDAFLRVFSRLMIEMLGPKRIEAIARESSGDGVFSVDAEAVACVLAGEDGKAGHVKRLVAALTEIVAKDFGRAFAEKKLAAAFDAMKQALPKESLPRVMDLVPPSYLEDDRVIYLSREALETKVREKTKELRDINANLEKIVDERTKKLEELLVERDEQNKILAKRSEELARANEELKKLDLIKSEFTSVAAHQLRTPLSAVKWTLDMLNRGDLGAILDEQRLYLSKAQESNDWVISLVNDLLHIEKIQAGTYQYDWKEHIQVENILESVIFEVQSLARKKSVAIHFEKGGAPRIEADPEKLRAVFQSLIENAVQYSNDTGEVRISTEKQKDAVIITVADDGIGIPASEQPRLFERFARASNAVRAVPDGFGLGLHIAKSIVDRHHGSISCRSEEGKGAAFIVTLPLRQPEQPAA